MSNPTNKFNYLWNDKSYEDRASLMPHMIETQKLHIWQCKQIAIAAHKAHMKELNEWLKSLDSELAKVVIKSKSVNNQ